MIENVRGLLEVSPALVNLLEDHEFKVRNTISIGMRPFGEAQSKAIRAYAQSGQYHTIMKSRDS